MHTEKLTINQNQQIYYHQIAINYWNLLLKILNQYQRTFKILALRLPGNDNELRKTEMYLILKILKARDLQ